MKITKSILASSLCSMLLALGAAGCEKSADLGRMQEATMELVKLHQNEIETLQRRADGDQKRGQQFGADVQGYADAGRLLGEARMNIDQLRAQANAASGQLTNAVKTGEVDEVERQSDEVLEKLDAGEIAVRKNLAAVESWLMSVENRPAAQQAAASQQMTPPNPPANPGTATVSGGGTETPPPSGAETPAPTGTEAGSGKAPAAAAGSGSGSAAK